VSDIRLFYDLGRVAGLDRALADKIDIIGLTHPLAIAHAIEKDLALARAIVRATEETLTAVHVTQVDAAQVTEGALAFQRSVARRLRQLGTRNLAQERNGHERTRT